ncbi:MAG: hypothetical protein KC620_22460 [Myxococcales bacterium]|nr:hypothetical protein [Myxococcales bacterium]
MTTAQALLDVTDRPLASADRADGLGLIDGLLRDQARIIDRIERGEALGALARACIITIAVTAAVTGATLGSFRGGLQIAYGAAKLPLVLLLTAGLCTPAFTALGKAICGQGDLRRDLAVMLSGLALAGLLISATAPVILLAMALGAGYHDLTLIAVACCAAGGAAGLAFFARALRRRPPGRRLLMATVLAVCALVGCQMAWTLRPYLVRPRSPETPFVRALEGSFLEAVAVSVDSARGIYVRDHAPLPGEPGRWQRSDR